MSLFEFHSILNLEITGPLAILALGPASLPPFLSPLFGARSRGNARYGVLDVIRDLNEIFGGWAKTRNNVLDFVRDDEDALFEAAWGLWRWWRGHALAQCMAFHLL